MIRFLKILPLLFLAWQAPAQILDPTEWSSELRQTGEGTYDLIIRAEMDEGWYIYSQGDIGEEGPIPTKFYFIGEGEGYTAIGETTEPDVEPKHDKVWDMTIKSFMGTAEFVQKIQLTDPGLTAICAGVAFMVCDDEQCLAPETRTFTFELQTGVDIDCKMEMELELDREFEAEMAALEAEMKVEGDEEPEKATTVASKPTDDDENRPGGRSLRSIFIVAFLGGFLALLTPCVFPMIPLTVSFFTKQGKTRATSIRNAVFYGFSIIFIYVFLGWLITWIFGADALNELSTNVWFNVAFFLLLVIFAISFFGAFDINLPSSWANRMDKQAGKGGLIGIFFMALALAIVSFSCTGPIVGTLLVEAAYSGGVIGPIVGMLGFSLAMAVPFMLFAMVPGWLNSLPKSGGWLNSVKVVLGFLELALAFKFLSNADLVLQLHLLEREVFLAIWIAVFGTLTLYLLKKIRLPHDSDNPRLSVGRLLFGITTLVFTIYLIPGLWGAPLKIISGFPPPMHYSESPYGVGGGGITEAEDSLPDGAKLGPHQIVTFIDYEKGMAYARKENKPVMIDFTGHACVNCRRMEERVWAEPEILRILKNDLVLISLYVDERIALPEDQQYVSPTTGKKIRTVGNKWSDFQIEHYSINAQPYYVLIDLDENPLNDPVGHTPNVASYKAWLEEGIGRFAH